MQLAACACLNAIWDLWCKVLGKPLWKLVTDMSPEEFVGVIDFRCVHRSHESTYTDSEVTSPT